MNPFNLFADYRTYIVAAVMGIAAFAKAADWITQEQLIMIESFLAAVGFATVRAAIAKNAAEVREMVKEIRGMRGNK